MSKRISLTQYLIEQQRGEAQIPAQLRLLIEVVARACKSIAISVNKGALGDVLGTAGSENVQGEVQKKLDIIANEVLIEANEWGGHLAGMASEEMDDMHAVPLHYPQGEYLLLFDPLDGSSNIDVNVSIGTIFSVLRHKGGDVTNDSFLQAGTEQVCAGYCVYGPQTTLVLTVGDGVVAAQQHRADAGGRPHGEARRRRRHGADGRVPGRARRAAGQGIRHQRAAVSTGNPVRRRRHRRAQPGAGWFRQRHHDGWLRHHGRVCHPCRQSVLRRWNGRAHGHHPLS